VPYDLQPMKAPRTAGFVLRVLVWLIELPVVGAALTHKLLSDAGLFRVRHTPCDDPLCAGPPLPRFDGAPRPTRPPIDLHEVDGLSVFPDGWRPTTSRD